MQRFTVVFLWVIGLIIGLYVAWAHPSWMTCLGLLLAFLAFGWKARMGFREDMRGSPMENSEIVFFACAAIAIAFVVPVLTWELATGIAKALWHWCGNGQLGVMALAALGILVGTWVAIPRKSTRILK